MIELIEAVVEPLYKGSLLDKGRLGGLLPGLNFDARGGVFEAKEEVAGVLDILRTPSVIVNGYSACTDR